MPRDSGGTYTLPANTLGVSGQTISSTYYNNAVNDFATEFTASLPVDGRKALTGKLLGYSGTASSPSYSFSSDTDTGIYPHASGGIGFAVDGSLKIWFKTDGTISDGTNTLSLSTIATNKVLGNLSGSTAYPNAITAVGSQTVWIPAQGCVKRTDTSGGGPANGSVTTSGQKVVLASVDFDKDTEEYIQAAIAMPKSWNNSTLTFQFVWSHASTTTNFGVVWGVQGLFVADDGAADTAFGTAQTVTDTGGTTNDIYVTSTTSALTVSNTPASGGVLFLQFYRVAANGSDTLAVDARLHGIKMIYTNTALTDD